MKITSNFYDEIKREAFEMLFITPDHTYAVGRLPKHRSDPFDRILIGQAKLERLKVATQDAAFKEYQIPVPGI